MIPVEAAIYRVRRDITLGVVLKGTFAVAILACLLFAPHSTKLAAMTGVVAVWLALGVTSARSSQIGVESPALIAAGEYEEAERQIDLAMRAFSLFSPIKLRALHQLAVLRHAQRRWQESAAICQAVLSQRRASRSLAKPAMLMLARSLIELSDLPGAHRAILGLYRQTLCLEDVLNLLRLQLDYESRIGAWTQMFNGIAAKTQLAELMPTVMAAPVQALLALSAEKVGRTDWSNWLRRRAELLVDVDALVAERPVLAEVWKKA